MSNRLPVQLLYMPPRRQISKCLALNQRYAHSYASSLNLPSSNLANRSNPRKFPELLKIVGSDLYLWQKQNLPGPPRILHDGPPYANGELHLGHALNKIVKDILNRYNVQSGQQVNYIPGWDCHGLPIELASLKEAQEKGRLPQSIGDRRKIAQKLANKMVAKQLKAFNYFGIMADWSDIYLTMNSQYVTRQLRVFADLLHRGLIVRQRKPVFWSCESKTALAESELEYGEKISPSVYVAFPVMPSGHILDKELADSSLMIWTTTPWTLPSNQAVAVGNDIEYCLVEVGGTRYILARSLTDKVMEHVSPGSQYKVLKAWRGSDLVGLQYKSPLTQEKHGVLAADHVTDSSGTGLVHTAPGHGKEDYLTAHHLGVLSPIDDKGRYNNDLAECLQELVGLDARTDGTMKVLSLLRTSNALLHQGEIQHSVPLDWRSKTPVMLRSTPQFFINLSDVKALALKAIESVSFKPETGRQRLESFIQSRTEWCVSRQRVWGVPIPVLHMKDTGEPLMSRQVVDHIINQISNHGDRGMIEWFKDESDLSQWIPVEMLQDNPELAASVRKGSDTMDVWFDSGSSWAQFNDDSLPAQVYLEGSDQHRGWFQSSLLTYVGSRGKAVAPYKEVITHGFILDENMQKMSKSLQNVVSPFDLIEGTNAFPALGIDGLRLYIAQTDYTSDVSLSVPTIKQVAAALKKLRLTFKFLLGNIEQFRPRPIESYKFGPLDTLALKRLSELCEEVKIAYESHDFNQVVKLIQVHMNTFLSALYFDTSKDILYTDPKTSARRQAIQFVLHETLAAYARILAPVIPLLTQEVWSVCPDTITQGLRSPGMAGWPKIHTPSQILNDSNLSKLLAIRSEVNEILEKARSEKRLGSSLASELYIEDVETCPFLQLLKSELAEILLVSKVHFGPPPDNLEWSYSAAGQPKLTIGPPSEHKCLRCWKYLAPVEDSLCRRCATVVEKLG